MTQNNGGDNGRSLAQRSLQTLNDLLVRVKPQIVRALPAGMSPERMMRQALTLASRNPTLLQCTAVSIAQGVVQAAELGLELSGVLGQAYLVPYYSSQKKIHEAVFQVGYRGLLALCYRSGKVSVIESRVVQDGDVFQVLLGTERTIHHEPRFGDGPPLFYYAVLSLAGSGERDIEVMSIKQIEKHRDQYSKAKDKGPWVTSFDEMARKTVLRRLCKRAPVSTEAMKASLLDEHGEMDVPQQSPVLEGVAEDQPLLVEDERTEQVGEKLRGKRKTKEEPAKTEMTPEEELIQSELEGEKQGDSH